MAYSHPHSSRLPVSGRGRGGFPAEPRVRLNFLNIRGDAAMGAFPSRAWFDERQQSAQASCMGSTPESGRTAGTRDARWKLKRIRIDGIWVGQRTRLAALTALLLSLGSTVVSGWVIYALETNVEALRRSGVIPQIGDRYDAVAAAAAVGRLDVLTIILAIGAIISAVGLVFSYTLFKAHAIASAIEEVQRALPGALREHLGQHGEQLVIAALKDAELIAHINRRFTELGLDDTEDAFSVDNEPYWNEEQA